MAAIPHYAFNITGATGTQGALAPLQSYRAYIFPRGANASQDSTGTLITFDSAAIASRFVANNWIQIGTAIANIRRVSAVGGNSMSVNTAVTVSENNRIFLIGNTQPTTAGGSATYTVPNTIIRTRGDDAADIITNSMLTSNVDGLVEFYAAPNMYDALIQDGDRGPAGYIADLEVGSVEGISALDWAFFGQSVTIHGALGVTGWATFGSTVTAHGALGVTGTLAVGLTATFSSVITGTTINAASIFTSGLPSINVKHPTYGARGDGVTDDTSAIQAAIDAANALFDSPLSGFGGAFVDFPVGIYIITSTLNWKRGAYLRGVGIGPYHTTHIRWNGATGGVMIADSGTAFSARLLEGIGFRKGTGLPLTILGISGNPDWSCRIQNCNFLGASGNLIECSGGWINLHMRDCRFDEAGDHAIRMVVGSGQNGSTFALDGFTFDSSGRAGNGFIFIDNIAANVSSAGTVNLRNGRIEINTTAMNDPSAIITLGITNVGANPRFVRVHVDSVFYQDSASSANDSLMRVTGSTAAADPAGFVIENTRLQNAASVLGGSWTSGVLVPLGTGNIPLAVHGEATNVTIVDDTLYFQSFDESYNVIRSFVGMDTNERFRLRSDGLISRGVSTSVPGVLFAFGSGSPEGVLGASIGSIYQRTDGGANTSIYVKEVGTTSSGWASK